jgi:hypothetical protein
MNALNETDESTQTFGKRTRCKHDFRSTSKSWSDVELSESDLSGLQPTIKPEIRQKRDTQIQMKSRLSGSLQSSHNGEMLQAIPE